MTDRPLWRTGTKQAIRRIKEAEVIQRAQAADLPLTILLDEARRRGWHVIPPWLPVNWPTLADEDELFEVGDE